MFLLFQNEIDMDECETAPALVEGKFAGMEFYSQKEIKIK
jgi:hypothetical protein